MKKILWLLLIPLLSGWSCLTAQTGMKALLPDKGEIRGWKVRETPELYKGDNLSSLVDGRAGLVSEYGFREAITADMVSDEGDRIRVEIYRMSDSFAALAMYLQNAGGDEPEYQVGNDSFINDYSIGFWKQYYFALISSSYSNDSIVSGMKLVADLVDSRIRNKGHLPEIFGRTDDSHGRITLIRGKIALSHVYHFTSRDIFRIEEGLAIEDENHTEIWFRYENPDESIHRLGEVAGFLSRDDRFYGFRMTGDFSFELSDSKNNNIEITSEGNYLRVDIIKARTD